MQGAGTAAGIEAKGLACRRGDRLLFRGLNLALGPGDACHVTGPNGTGKSSLLRLIAAGIDTPVYRLRLDGFDTHENQLGRHRVLLQDLALGVADLRRRLIGMGEWERTAILTYSEFGRRASENDSGGTDHGTAAPHFLIGGSVAGGLYGRAPDLGSRVDDDPRYTMDYRAVYDAVLARWFGVADSGVAAYRERQLERLFG